MLILYTLDNSKLRITLLLDNGLAIYDDRHWRVYELIISPMDVRR